MVGSGSISLSLSLWNQSIYPQVRIKINKEVFSFQAKFRESIKEPVLAEFENETLSYLQLLQTANHSE